MPDTEQNLSWESLQEEMIRWRRDLHQIPEIGLELPQTARYVRDVLDKYGIAYESLLEGNAVVAQIEGTKAGRQKPRVIALRADMDGLAVREETGLPFASENGNMHACGHDAHMAMLLGAALWLQVHRSEFSGIVKCFFQPGEERPGGALPMIREGCLENPRVDAIFGMHNGKISRELPDGAVGWRRGAIMASVDVLTIKIKGKGGHGGYPEDCIDPITTAAEFIQAVQLLISRELKPGDPAVLSFGSIKGGSSMNIIPDEVVIEGTCRNSSQETRKWLARRIREVGEAVCGAHRAAFEINHHFMYPPLINDAAFSEAAALSIAKVVGEERLYELKYPVMAGEDFACFAERLPAAYVFLSNMKPVGGRIYPHHSSRFDVDERAFADGAEIFVQVALDFLASAPGEDESSLLHQKI